MEDIFEVDPEIHPIYYHLIYNKDKVNRFSWSSASVDIITSFEFLFSFKYSQEYHASEILHLQSLIQVSKIVSYVVSGLFLASAIFFSSVVPLIFGALSYFLFESFFISRIKSKLELINEVLPDSPAILDLMKLVKKQNIPELTEWLNFIFSNRKIITNADLDIVKAIIDIDKAWVDITQNIKAFNDLSSEFTKK